MVSTGATDALKITKYQKNNCIEDYIVIDLEWYQLTPRDTAALKVFSDVLKYAEYSEKLRWSPPFSTRFETSELFARSFYYNIDRLISTS